MSMALKRELQHCDTVYKDALQLLCLDISNHLKAAFALPNIQPLYHLDVKLSENRLNKSKKMGRTKGFFKKKGTWFKRGHSKFHKRLKEKNISNARECQRVRYVRLDETEQALVENNPILPNAVAEDEGSDNEGAKFKFLRARSCNASNYNFKLSTADRHR